MSQWEPFDLSGNSLKANWLPTPNPLKWSFPSATYFSPLGPVVTNNIRVYNPPTSVQTGNYEASQIVAGDDTWTV